MSRAHGLGSPVLFGRVELRAERVGDFHMSHSFDSLVFSGFTSAAVPLHGQDGKMLPIDLSANGSPMNELQLCQRTASLTNCNLQRMISASIWCTQLRPLKTMNHMNI